MRYLLTIWDAERDPTEERDPEQMAEVMGRYRAFNEAAEAAGVLLAKDGLQHSSTATVVRVQDDERLVTDGPFAETHEQLVGFYLLECKDLDEALAWAERVPAARMGGAIEVRPVMDYEALAARMAAAGEGAAS